MKTLKRQMTESGSTAEPGTESDSKINEAMKELNVSPLDEYNRELVDNVHPPDWVNPEPSGRYNMVVIGAGTAGLVAAAGAAGLGAKVALIERKLMGGDCLNVGCVPSKTIIKSSRAAHDIKEAKRFGIKNTGEVEVDFGEVMKRLRKVRAEISPNDSAKKFRDTHGVDVYMGDALFTGPDRIEVDGKALEFKYAVIATGARAVAPPIEGLKKAGYLTNETVFNLTELPGTLVVIGGGPIGSELSQAFRRLGSEVHIIEMNDQFLNREDRDAAEILEGSLKRDGVNIHLSSSVSKVEVKDGKKLVHVKNGDSEEVIEADEILVGAGRAPNVEYLGLEEAGVEYDRNGVKVDDRMRTTNKRIFAAGDVAMKYKFTHTADFAARIVIQNALFKGRKKLSSLVVPWTTYTDPEIAHVGMYEHEAKEKGIEVDTYKKDFADVDRAIAEGETEGFVKIHTKKGTGEILGATIVASHAGEMISEITTAMVGGVGLGTIASAIHPYPTQAEAIRHDSGGGDTPHRRHVQQDETVASGQKAVRVVAQLDEVGGLQHCVQQIG